MATNWARRHVANFSLDDCTTQQIVDYLSFDRSVRKIAVGVHITTLNSLYRKDLACSDFDIADVIYCDGWSMYILGKCAGLKKIQRIATTDLYPKLIEQLNSPLKIFFLGGDASLGPSLKRNWLQKYPLDSCDFSDGFPKNWSDALEYVVSKSPNILFLGLGMPLELQILNQYKRFLPNCLIISCGGMLRLLAGVEKRSPKCIQLLRLEWLYRLTTSPRRTFSRYFIGLINVFRTFVEILFSRLVSKK